MPQSQYHQNAQTFRYRTLDLTTIAAVLTQMIEA